MMKMIPLHSLTYLSFPDGEILSGPNCTGCNSLRCFPPPISQRSADHRADKAFSEPAGLSEMVLEKSHQTTLHAVPGVPLLT